jgi:hypothetical protein
VAKKIGKNSFKEAADACGVPLGEFKLWLVEHCKASPGQWSKWGSGVEDVPKKFLFAFMREKIGAASPRSTAAQ